ncbi:hypothetical protein B5X24_HaOG210141 [Helicoverpa armigera]|uniref:Uncharacterized protein n=1 Tax=Helicoverpa armigera TaxID=29058 RepID=A0A2W1BMY9_HELAM|nr:hypothetical protein B5X24_HaOG210141 [Helicoverpa armigera]
MYSVYAFIILFIIKNSAAAVVHLEAIKLNANGASNVTQSSNISVSSTTESVNEETKTTEVRAIEENHENPSIKSPVTEEAKNVPENVKVDKTEHDSSAVKQGKLNKREKKVQFKISILKDPTTSSSTTTTTTEVPVKKIPENIIETRRMSGSNIYVPVSDDIRPKYDEDTFGKGIVRSGLSLIDLKGNILRIRL